jgi:hypothetical protein
LTQGLVRLQDYDFLVRDKILSGIKERETVINVGGFIGGGGFVSEEFESFGLESKSKF